MIQYVCDSCGEVYDRPVLFHLQAISMGGERVIPLARFPKHQDNLYEFQVCERCTEAVALEIGKLIRRDEVQKLRFGTKEKP